MDPQRVRVYQIEALVLRQQDYAEADRILTLCTPHGKLRAVAKGTRRSTSHKAGHLDLFMRAELQLAKGRNLDIIIQAECQESYDALRSDALRFTYACYVAELLEYVIREDEQPEVYYLAVDTLRRINSEVNPSIWARYFDITLLSYAGFQPDLYHCVRCGREIQAEMNYFSLEQGGLVCPSCYTNRALQVSLYAQKLLRFLQRNKPADINRLTVADTTLGEVEHLMLLYWQHVLEREVKSAVNLRQLQNEMTIQSQPLHTNTKSKQE
ncbi:MAG: DNA repair protein RecO [Chloroflexi bacterium]|nr:DNA repair protein RecO [Chloroflexota bacterium]